MRRKHIKNGGGKTPDIIVRMGLDEAYREFAAHCIEREKTHEVIWVKNPPHCKCKAYKVDIWQKTEDADYIYAETMFGKRETFKKEDLILT